MNSDCRYMKIIYMHCGEETNIRDPRSYEHYWASSWNNTWKKIHRLGPQIGSTDWVHRLGPNKPSKWWKMIVDIWKSYIYMHIYIYRGPPPLGHPPPPPSSHTDQAVTMNITWSPIKLCTILMIPPCLHSIFGSISVPGKLPTYPSPSPTLTLTRCQLNVVELGEG